MCAERDLNSSQHHDIYETYREDLPATTTNFTGTPRPSDTHGQGFHSGADFQSESDPDKYQHRHYHTGPQEHQQTGSHATRSNPTTMKGLYPHDNFQSSNLDQEREEYDRSTRMISSVNPLPQEEALEVIGAYHGNMGGERAEELLQDKEEARYLIRYSHNQGKYVLSLMTDQGEFKHYGLKVDKENSRYEIEGTGKQFHKLHSLLEYYQNCPVDTEGICIGEPCFKEAKGRKTRQQEISNRMFQKYFKDNGELKKKLEEENRDLKEQLAEQRKFQEQLLDRLAPKTKTPPPSEELALLKEQVAQQKEMLERLLPQQPTTPPAPATPAAPAATPVEQPNKKKSRCTIS